MTEERLDAAQMIPSGLTKQHYMIEWLAKEDFSLYGEVEGRDFDALHSAMLVQIHGKVTGPRAGYAQVSLTPLGLAVAKHLRETKD